MHFQRHKLITLIKCEGQATIFKWVWRNTNNGYTTLRSHKTDRLLFYFLELQTNSSHETHTIFTYGAALLNLRQNIYRFIDDRLQETEAYRKKKKKSRRKLHIYKKEKTEQYAHKSTHLTSKHNVHEIK